MTAIPNYNYVKKTSKQTIAAIIIKTTYQRVSESQASSKMISQQNIRKIRTHCIIENLKSFEGKKKYDYKVIINKYQPKKLNDY